MDEDGDAEDQAKDPEESQGMLQMSAAEYSIEGLRKEVLKGKANHTDYERESCLTSQEQTDAEDECLQLLLNAQTNFQQSNQN